MSRSFSLFKSILWAIIGVGAVVTVVRFSHGLGATTGLTDSAPWGLWIAFDVMGGVALAAGGFVLAATVYIFRLERYRPFVRPAILTAFLGYLAVAIGLQYDLGLPWHIWHIFIYPQHHSVLFEVGMCVVLYLTVLGLEFSPVVLEHQWFKRPVFQSIHAVVKRFTILLVIAGIVLSTLHQSSLGSLFLIQPFRVHPLWYSPIVYVLFFVSAAGLGLMMVTLESLLSGWFFGHKIRTDLLGGLGRAASIVLFVYAGLRIGDLVVRGQIGHAFDGSWQGSLFLFELCMSALLPAILLAVRRVRTSVAGLAICAGFTVLGMIGYRFDICVVTFTRPDGMPYLPTWMELAVSAAVVSGAILVFIFFVEHLKVYDDAPDEHTEPFIPPRDDVAGIPEPHLAMVASPRRYSLIVVMAAALTVGILPADAVFGPQPDRTAVSPPRTLEAVQIEQEDGDSRSYVVPGLPLSNPVPDAGKRSAVKVMLINGNRDARSVIFNHRGHVHEFGGDESCVLCHHQNLPFDQNTACHQCHREMYEVSDTFDHVLHVQKVGGDAGCMECHAGDPARKTRETAKACGDCHDDMIVKGSRIAVPENGLTGFAVSYMDAMHGLCVRCHKDEAVKRNKPHHARCDVCHKEEVDPAEIAKFVIEDRSVRDRPKN